jgi:hypothetical protein
MPTAELAALVMAILMTGCAAAPQNIATPVTVEVPVPTPVYCPAPHLEHPALALAALKPDSAPAETIRAYAASVAVLEGAVVERDDIIAGCIAPAPGGGGGAVEAPASEGDGRQ